MLRLMLVAACLGVGGLLVAGGVIVFSPAGGPGEGLRTGQIDDSIIGAFERLRTPELSPIIAIVNGTEIHRTEVQYKVNLIEEASGRLEGAETWQVTPRAELSAQVRRVVMHQDAVRRGLQCTPEEVQVEVAWDLEAFPQLARSWASFLGVSADDLAHEPEVLRKYERVCSNTALLIQLANEKGLDPVSAESTESFHRYVDRLVDAAVVEILEPSLQ